MPWQWLVRLSAYWFNLAAVGWLPFSSRSASQAGVASYRRVAPNKSGVLFSLLLPLSLLSDIGLPLQSVSTRGRATNPAGHMVSAERAQRRPRRGQARPGPRSTLHRAGETRKKKRMAARHCSPFRLLTVRSSSDGSTRPIGVGPRCLVRLGGGGWCSSSSVATCQTRHAAGGPRCRCRGHPQGQAARGERVVAFARLDYSPGGSP